jgi:hypothetical protein
MLSSFAFKFNLRRYNVGDYGLGGALQLDSIKTRVDSAPGFRVLA